jgi:hypothetical protein
MNSLRKSYSTFGVAQTALLYISAARSSPSGQQSPRRLKTQPRRRRKVARSNVDIPHRVRAVYGRHLGIAGATVAIPTWHCSTGITASARCAPAVAPISRNTRWTVADSPYGAHLVSEPGGSGRGAGGVLFAMML